MSKQRRLKPSNGTAQNLERRRCAALVQELERRGLYQSVDILAEMIDDDTSLPFAAVIKLDGPPAAYSDQDIADLRSRDLMTLARTIADTRYRARVSEGRHDLAETHRWAREMLAQVTIAGFSFNLWVADNEDQSRLPEPVQVGDVSRLRPTRVPTAIDGAVRRFDAAELFGLEDGAGHAG